MRLLPVCAVITVVSSAVVFLSLKNKSQGPIQAGEGPVCLSCSAFCDTGERCTARIPSFQPARNKGHNCFRWQGSHSLFRMVKRNCSVLAILHRSKFPLGTWSLSGLFVVHSLVFFTVFLMDFTKNCLALQHISRFSDCFTTKEHDTRKKI